MSAGGPGVLSGGVRSRRRAVVLALLALALAAAPAFATWMVPPQPYRAKDFAFLKRGALYHIFYTNTNTLSPDNASEQSFGHAVSSDLYVWTRLDTVLPVRPGEWDSHRVWAPHIIASEGVYYMFYTGVGSQYYQRTGLATSTDLYTWNRLDAPVFGCAQAPWVYCDSTTTAGGNLRDPFVMPDPAHPGGWLQYYSTVPAVDLNRYVVGVAASNGDLAQWTDLKPLWATYHANTGYELAESPHLFQRDGLWYLLFTTNGAQPLRWATGSDPVGEPAAWTQRGTVSATVGLDTRFWFASEHLRDGLREYFAFVNFDRVDVREMQWRPDGTFSLTQPDLFHVTYMGWDRDSVEQGDAAELTLRCVNWTGRSARIEVVELHDGSEEPIPNQAIELPDSIPIADSVVTLNWAARRWQGATDTDTSVTRLLVRTTDRTTEARVLYVGPPGFCGSGGSDPGGEIIDPALRRHDPPLGRHVLRTLTRAPVGGGLALLVELDRPQSARLDVFDLQGRRLGTLADRALPAGATVVPWDPARLGGALRPGIYFARLVTPGATHWTRVVLAPR